MGCAASAELHLFCFSSLLEISEFVFTFNIEKEESSSLPLLPSTKITSLEWVSYMWIV